MAFAHINIEDSRLKVQDWNLIKPELPTEFSLEKFVHECQDILQNRLYNPNIDAYCIERQSWRRIGPSNTIPHSILRAISVETIIFALLAERTRSNSLIESISARAVAECFDMRSDSSTLKYQDKKKRAVGLVETWIAEKTIDFPSKVLEMYQASAKKDDLCDALIMATAYAKWNQNSLDFIANNPVSKSKL